MNRFASWLRKAAWQIFAGNGPTAPRKKRSALLAVHVLEERALPSAALPAVLDPPTTFTSVLGTASPDKTTGTQTDRLFRDGLVPTCASPKTFRGTLPIGPTTFDEYTLTNTSTTPLCVEVQYHPLNGNGANLFAVAYLDSFNPSNISQNWLSDAGLSPGESAITFSFTVPALHTINLVFNDTRAAGSFVGNAYSFTLSNGIKFNPPALPGGVVGTSYSQRITTTGGAGAVVLRVTGGALPPGLTLNANTGVLSGTPTIGGKFTFLITATDSMGETSTHLITLEVHLAIFVRSFHHR